MARRLTGGRAGANTTGTVTLNILLVEDNELNRDMLARRLTRRGYAVECAPDGETGVRLARETRPDVILMDIGLPSIDGWEAIRQLKSQPDTRDIPIITLTAHAFTEDRLRSEAAGCAGFVTKPIDIERLLTALREIEESGAKA